MSELLAARTALAAALDGGDWLTHKAPPDSIDPPCIIVQPAENYLQQAEQITFADTSQYLVTVEVYTIADLAGSEEAVDDLDVMQEFVVANLPPDWWLESTGQPDTLNNGDWQAYGNRLTVQTQLTISKEVTP